MDVAIDKVAAKAARSHEGTPSARDPASLEAEFSAFNKKRAEEKLLLYERVFSVGLRILLVGLLASIVLIFVADYTNTCVADCRNGPGLIAAKSFLVVLSVSIPTGYVMLASVPPNEFDIDKWFDTDTSSGLRALSKSLVRLLSFSLLLIFGTFIFIIPFPFVIGLPIIAYAIWVLWEITPRETNELRRRCGLSIVQSAVHTLPAREQPEWLRLSKPSHITTVIAGALFCIVSGCFNLSLMNIVGDTPSSPFYLGVLSRPIVQSRVLINGAVAAICILGLIAMLYSWRAAAAHGAANGRGWWRTAALYEFKYILDCAHLCCRQLLSLICYTACRGLHWYSRQCHNFCRYGPLGTPWRSRTCLSRSRTSI